MPTAVIHFDASFENLAQIHDALQTHLDLPDYYGRNSDALWDVLTGDIETPVILVWHDFEQLRARLGHPITHLQNIYQAAQAANPDIRIVFR